MIDTDTTYYYTQRFEIGLFQITIILYNRFKQQIMAKHITYNNNT